MATDVNLGMLSLEELRRLLGQTQAATPSSQVGVSPYQQIMGRMPLLQNPYAGVSGGYNNFQGGYNPNLYSSAPRAIGQLGFGGGGGGSGGSEAAAPSAWSSMTPAEQAAYYAANPTMATITQLGQKAFGYTGLGRLQAMMDPNLVTEQSLIAMGVNPAAYQSAKESFRASEIADMNAAAEAAANAAMNAQSMQSMQDALAADTAAAQAQSVSDQNTGGDGGGYGGYSDGGGSSSFGEGQYNMGGPVDRVGGPNPPGPDDGTGMLQLGEYVIKKSAVKKYGQGLLDMINDGKIPAKKMKSLLG
jgi:hypothetical protein